MIVLIHTSKTMRAAAAATPPTGKPALLERAVELVDYVRTLSEERLAAVMGLSGPLATRTHQQFAAWGTGAQGAAVESFLGDIYSGLQVAAFTARDREHADRHLRILSGLYGILRPFDAISPYRLEMGCRLPDPRYASLYAYWGAAIADQLPRTGPIVNLAAGEYSRAVLPHLDATRVVTPKFLSVDPASGKPRFVAVHAKIARGAFARWLVTTRATGGTGAVGAFADLGYRLDPSLSTDAEPAFVCEEFLGKGLSVRLT
jgi:cytoplasmic iron level regulating protein YaaA (DUF328/UPF0246 family)